MEAVEVHRHESGRRGASTLRGRSDCSSLDKPKPGTRLLMRTHHEERSTESSNPFRGDQSKRFIVPANTFGTGSQITVRVIPQSITVPQNFALVTENAGQ